MPPEAWDTFVLLAASVRPEAVLSALYVWMMYAIWTPNPQFDRRFG